MPINQFNFGSTHAWADHAAVKDAVNSYSRGPLYVGMSHLGSSFSVQTVEAQIPKTVEAEARYEKMLHDGRCAGYSDQALETYRVHIKNAQRLRSSLETIRDYMKSYSPGCC